MVFCYSQKFYVKTLCLDIFKRNMAKYRLDNIFSPILKNSGKKLIFLKNNCFRKSHMGCEARFLSLMVFLSFPQLNFIFRASIINCPTAVFARFRYFQKGCSWYFQHPTIWLQIPLSSIFSFIITSVGDILWSGKYGDSIARGGGL